MVVGVRGGSVGDGGGRLSGVGGGQRGRKCLMVRQVRGLSCLCWLGERVSQR